MSDQVAQAVDAGQVVSEPTIENVQTESSAPVESTPQTAEEKMLPQSQVNKIVTREARSAAEKARREEAVRYEKMMADAKQNSSQVQATTMGGMLQLSPEQLEQKILETAYKVANKNRADQIWSEFQGKVDSAKTSDPEFADKYESLGIENHPELIIWMNGLDNTTDIIRDIADNPYKMSNVLMLAKSGLGHLAQKELKKLSDSIKLNEEAKKQKTAQEPLGQITPSAMTIDNGSASVSDFMKMNWLRG